ncbi:MAG: fibronectin type III domain-containing protein [bacterium]
MERIKKNPKIEPAKEAVKTRLKDLNVERKFWDRFNFKKTFSVQKIAVFLQDHWHLLSKSAAENHLRIAKIKAEKNLNSQSNLNFNSYSHLKNYQKKVKLFTYSFSSTAFSIFLAIIAIQVFFPGGITHSATFHFAQTSWATQSANVAVHNSNQTLWSEFQSKDAGIALANGGNDLQLQQITQAVTQTTEADFNAGTKTNTETLGTGNSASLSIVKDLSVNEYTVGHLANVSLTVTAVNQAGPWLLVLSGTPNLSRIFKNDKFVDSTGKPWKVLSLNPSNTTPRLLVIDSEGNGGSPASGVGSVGRWYSDLAAWEAGRQGDLVARNAVERALPYYDVGPDTTPLAIAGWTTDATHYVEINVPLGERHRGKWDDGKYSIQYTSNTGGIGTIDISTNYVKIIGLQIKRIGNNRDYLNGINAKAITGSNGDIIIDSNLITSNCAGGSQYNAGIDARAPIGINVKISNNIIYDWKTTTVSNYGIYASNNAYIYNNTLYNVGGGFFVANSTPVLKNNIVNGTTGIEYVGTFSAASAGNISDDATSPNVALRNKAVAFVDAANKDFHLEFNDTVAKNAGVDLSADANLPISTDIDGDIRAGTWDIGADDVGAVYVHVSSIGSGVGMDFATLQNWVGWRSGNLTNRGVYKISGQIGIFTADEVIIGQTSGNQGTYTKEHNTATANEKYLTENPTTGYFQQGEVVVGQTSGAQATVLSVITTTGIVEKGEAYKCSVFTDGVNIAGSTVDANHYMWLTVEPRSRHWGVAGTGVIISPGAVASNIISVSNQYTIIDGFEITNWGTDDNQPRYAINIGFRGIVANNLIYNPRQGVSTRVYGIGMPADNSTENPVVYNNIIYNFTNSNIGWGINSGRYDNIYNNTVYNILGNSNFNYSIRLSGGNEIVYEKNNITANCTTGTCFTFLGGTRGDAYENNNISSDATAPGTNSKTNQTLADIKFVSTDSSLIDLHLMPGSVAKNAGADLSATFKTDIDGNHRLTGANSWDIGADEWQASSPIFKTSGIFESNSVDLGVKADISSITLNANTTAGTNIKTQIAVNNDNATWNYVDIGQNQSGIPIYYSVGQNTLDHKTGSPTISITSGVATFSVAQTATNMGVGDKITYNASSVVYIAGKISTTQWKVVTKLGAVPADVTSQTVNSIAHAFSSLSAAVTGASGANFLNTTDLVTNNYQLNLPCYYDTGADTTAVAVSGYTTGVNNFIKIYTPNNVSSEANQSQRHAGKWDNLKYSIRISFAAVFPMVINISNVVIDGLMLEYGFNQAYRGGILVDSASSLVQNVNVSDNIIRTLVNQSNSTGINLSAGGYGQMNVKIYNNIIYNFIGTGSFGIFNNSGSSNYIFNNSVYGSTTGFASNGAVLKNNIANGNVADYSGSFNVASVNNISQDATSPNIALRNKTVQFIDAANFDFHLSPSDTAAKNAGTNLSADVNFPFSADIDGQYRNDTWDIGADEEGAPSSLGANRYVKYKTSFTSDSTNTPSLNDITLGYTSYPAAASLISSSYNTTDNANIFAKLAWNQIVDANTAVTMQARTSADGNTWTSWMGPDGTSGTEFSDPTGATIMPTAISDGSNDKFIQYKAILHSDGTATPTLSDVQATYVVNAPPELQNVTGVQNTDGIVSISYDVRDQDTTTGNLNGFVNSTLQYCTANCSSNGSETWTNAVATSGSLGSVAVQEGSFSTYTATWNAKTDYNGVYNANMKIRIKVDDNEAANNLAYGISPIFILDTKNPANVSLTVDGSTKRLSIAVPADDSTYQMLVSNFADFHDATAESFAASKNWPTMTSDPSTVYLKVIDAKGNFATTSSTTPQKPKNMVYFDVSNSAAADFREFIAWSVISPAEVGTGFDSYQIERKEDTGSFANVGQQTDRLANFYMDNNLNTSILYSYRALTKDLAGNKSAFSDTVSDIPNGQGGTDTTPPTITNVSISNITPTTAEITWTTDELSDSIVGYSPDTSFLPEYGIGSMVMTHSVILSNLTPETSYNIKVKSRDPMNNLGQVEGLNPGSNAIGDFSFTTLAGPKISNVIITQVNNNDATISWKTDINADAKINYSETISGGVLINPQSLADNASGKNHQITLFGLLENTKYYFEVASKDSSNNETIDKNGGNFFELTTTQDSTAPVISNLTTAYVSKDAAVITFTTDESAKVKISYGKTSKNIVQNITTFDRSHGIFLSGLTPDKDYIYDIQVTDINGNVDTSAEQTFKTLKDAEFAHSPLSSIVFADPNPSILTDVAAVIAFSSDQAAKCFVEYGSSAGIYDAVPKSEDVFNVVHGIQLNGLLFNTKYFYKVTCKDNLDTTIFSGEKDFTTKEQLYTAAGAGALGDKTAPVLSNISVGSITGESATISWDSDEKASSNVGYGIINTDENGASDRTVNKDVANYSTKHSVLVSGLIPATKYIFVASSTDAVGNISQSSQSSFQTDAPSSLSSIKAQSTALGQAIITWQTSTETSSIVEYGLTTSYGEIKENKSQTTDHQIELSSLNQGITYHYRVKGKDVDGKYFSSSDQTFEPKSPAKITNISINDISEHGAIVSFRTDVPTDANVTYTDVRDSATTGSQGSRNLATEHKIELINLNQGTTFSISISAKDEQGTEATIKAQDLTTGKDENPPRIDNIKTDNALTQADKVQSIISWKTDEQSTSSILYKEGRNGEEKEMKISDNLTTNHVGVVTIFKAGTVYNFRVKSVDVSGNEGISNDFALLTPRRKENIIQIIIGNFTDIFGWAKF